MRWLSSQETRLFRCWRCFCRSEMRSAKTNAVGKNKFAIKQLRTGLTSTQCSLSFIIPACLILTSLYFNVTVNSEHLLPYIKCSYSRHLLCTVNTPNILSIHLAFFGGVKQIMFCWVYTVVYYSVYKHFLKTY